jgi:hypothetical protein
VTAVAAPQAQNDAALTTTNQPVVLRVLDNDSNEAGGAVVIDLDSDQAGIQSELTVTQGVFKVQSDEVLFTPTTNTSSVAQVSYVITNRLSVTSNKATLTVTISSTVPVARDDATTTTNGVTVRVNVLSNDANPVIGDLEIDLDPDQAGVQTDVQQANVGRFVVDTSAVIFTPLPGFIGTATLGYVVQNQLGLTSNRARISVTVRGVTTSVRGMTFQDLNGDGVRQASEPSLGNVRLEIRDAVGTVQSLSSDANGQYQLEVAAGTVNVSASTPTGWVATTATNNTLLINAGSTLQAPHIGFARTPDLELTLQLSPQRLRVGETLVLQATLRNPSALAARNAVLTVRFPASLRLVSADATTSTSLSDDQLIVTFALGNVAAQSERRINAYFVVTPVTAPGEKHLQAQAVATFGAADGPATRTVSAPPAQFEVISDQSSALVGIVFIDANSNGRRDADEATVSGARVVLSSGQVSIADARGRYSFDQLPSGRYWVRIDPNSVPFAMRRLDGLETRVVNLDALGVTALDFALDPNQPVVQNKPFSLGAGLIEARYTSAGFSAALGLRGLVRGSWFGWNWFVALQTDIVYDNALRLRAPGFGLSAKPALTGDASSQTRSVSSDNGVYLRVEGEGFQAEYGRFSSPLSNSLLTPGQVQGLRVSGRIDEGITLSGVVSATAATRRNVSTERPFGEPGRGQREYAIPSQWLPVVIGSERVMIATRDRFNPELKIKPDRILQAGIDYAFDPETGIIRLFQPIMSTDLEGNLLFLEVSVSSARDTAFNISGGLRADVNLEPVRFSATTAWLPTSQSVFAGVGARGQFEGLTFGADLAWAGDFAGAAELSYQNAGFRAQLQYRQLGSRYSAATAEMPGLNLTATTQYSFGPIDLGQDFRLDQFALGLSANHRTPYGSGSASTTVAANAYSSLGASQVALGYTARFADAEFNPGQFVNLGFQGQFEAWGVNVLQRIPVSVATYGETEWSARVALDANHRLIARGQLVYAPEGIRGDAWVGLEGTVGGTQYRFGYALPSASESGVASALAFSAQMPLNSAIAISLGGEAQWREDQPLRIALQTGLLVTDERLRGSWTLEIGYQRDIFDLRSNVALVVMPTDDVVVAPTLKYGTQNNQLDFTLQGALRLEGVTVLTQHQGRFSSLQSFLTGDLRSSIVVSAQFTARVGLAYRLDQNVLTLTTALGGTQLFDGFGLGGQLLTQWQPVTNTTQIAFGIEANVPLEPGLNLILGVNMIGYGSSGTWQTAPGVYVRLEYSFEQFIRVLLAR